MSKKHPARVKFIGNPEHHKKMGKSWVNAIEILEPVRFDEDGISINESPIRTRDITRGRFCGILMVNASEAIIFLTTRY